MASYHCSVKPVCRGKGRTVTAAAAYRAGVRLEDERTGEVHDFTRKHGVASSEIITPDGSQISRERLWNLAEAAERRKDARVGREYEVALPAELTPAQRRDLALEFAHYLAKHYGVAVDVAIHAPSREGDNRNFHAHILTTTRTLEKGKLSGKADIELEDKALRAQGKPSSRQQVEAVRATWAEMTNRALERAGHESRVDHRTLEAQGLDREPSRHLGPAATAMERRGQQTDRALNAPDREQGEDRERGANDFGKRAEAADLDVKARYAAWKENQAQAKAAERQAQEREREAARLAQEREEAQKRAEKEAALERIKKARSRERDNRDRGMEMD